MIRKEKRKKKNCHHNKFGLVCPLILFNRMEQETQVLSKKQANK